MRKLMEGIRYWGQLLLLPVYWISFLVPRDKNIWLFGSTFGRRFADNPRYLYLYVSQHSKKSSEKLRKEIEEWKRKGHQWSEDKNCEHIRPIWISHDKEIVSFLQDNGYESYYYHSLKGIWYALRGKVYLFDNYSKDINFWQSGGALKVNLWHGIPLKKIQADNVFDKVRHPKNLWEKWKSFPRNLSDEKKHHYVLTNSEFMRPIFASAFRTENVLISGYPRNDSMLDESLQNLLTSIEKKVLNFIRSRIQDEALQMIYYMPTFRDSETKFFEVADVNALNQFFVKHKLLLCIKLHPKSKLKTTFEEISGGNIIVIDADTDPYVFIEDSSLLITDYSSIYFDYVLCGKPVIFFDYDLEEYLRDEREMYFDYEEYTPGAKVSTLEDLEKCILDTLKHPTAYEQERELMIEKMFDDGKAPGSTKLVELIQSTL